MIRLWKSCNCWKDDHRFTSQVQFGEEGEVGEGVAPDIINVVLGSNLITR